MLCSFLSRISLLTHEILKMKSIQLGRGAVNHGVLWNGMGWDEIRLNGIEWWSEEIGAEWQGHGFKNNQYCQIVVDGYLTAIHPEVNRSRRDTLYRLKNRNWEGCFHWDQETVDSYSEERKSYSWAWSWSSPLWMGEIVLMKSPHLSLPKRLNKWWCSNSIPILFATVDA